MKAFVTQLRHALERIFNGFKRTERIDEAKAKWNRLAKQNARYFVLTDKGEQITEEEFRAAGIRDVEEHVMRDPCLADLMADSHDKNVLEIGCGIGRLSEFLAPHFNHFYGVDISEEMIAQAKKRLALLSNTSFYSTDGLSFPIPEESVDFVFSFIVFQHMPSVEVVRKNIEEIARVLRPGGLVKIQLRGIPVSKDKWYYGPSFNAKETDNLISGLPFRILKKEGEGQKYFWLVLKKAMTASAEAI